MAILTAAQIPKVIQTIGDLIHDGYRLTCWCNRCGGFKPDADLEALAAKLGRDFVFVDRRGNRLDRHLACPDCGAQLETRLAPNGPGMGRQA